ncbi:hypothetical protein [Mycolicibacterium moriokaense]|uniref:Uncharacterized protein n=1 Tax=Mycolicibacterium moriokaense TaxID=39691 RepID=A0AAD1H7E5_9MYCO|nr:hypothetical protein [Mycolicibacterium moriokaense]MCV7037493.1 hypothetical protein [Mycolicibacterium moriokaense]BBW99569.1 hypothetical protein MMOR_05060 [Mycolicibacterium moriokaense]
MTDVRLSKPGDAITEAEITEFHIEDEAMVDEGEWLYSIANDKVGMDIQALIAVIS